MTTPPAPLPGWYPEPSGGSGLRYWDGREWTAVAPAPPPPAPSATPTGGPIPPPAKRDDGGSNQSAQQPHHSDRRTIAMLLAVVAVVIIGIGLFSAFRTPPPPAPDEDAYIDALFTSKFDVLLPKRPFIEEGYAACELLRAGHTEEDAAFIMWQRDTSKGTVPEMVRERHQRQTAAAHKYLCADA